MGLSTRDSMHVLSQFLASLTCLLSWRSMHSFALFLITEECCISCIWKGEQGNVAKVMQESKDLNPASLNAAAFFFSPKKRKIGVTKNEEACIKIFISSLPPLNT